MIIDIFAARIGTVLIIVSALSLPDAQNPHAAAGAVLAVIGGALWALGDIAVLTRHK